MQVIIDPFGDGMERAAQIADDIAAGFDACKSDQATNVAINIRSVAAAIRVAVNTQRRGPKP